VFTTQSQSIPKPGRSYNSHTHFSLSLSVGVYDIAPAKNRPYQGGDAETRRALVPFGLDQPAYAIKPAPPPPCPCYPEMEEEKEDKEAAKAAAAEALVALPTIPILPFEQARPHADSGSAKQQRQQRQQQRQWRRRAGPWVEAASDPLTEEHQYLFEQQRGAGGAGMGMGMVEVKQEVVDEGEVGDKEELTMGGAPVDSDADVFARVVPFPHARTWDEGVGSRGW
jgi:hypothetical protein